MIDLYSQLNGKSIRIGGRNAALQTTAAYSLVATIADQASSNFSTPQTMFASGGVQTAVKLQVSSTNNTADKNATGGNAWKIRVVGLDANWAMQYEDIALNGQTAVESTKTFMRVFGTQIISHGAAAIAAGDIYVYKTGTALTTGAPTNKANGWAKILTGFTQGTNAYFTVPAGHNYKIGDLYATCRGQPATVMLAIQDPNSANLAVYPIGTVELTTTSSGVVFPNLDSTVIPEKTDILLMAMGTTAAVVSVQLGLTKLVV